MLYKIEVQIYDDEVCVRCCGGSWYNSKNDNPILWLLGAIAFPEEHHPVDIQDFRILRNDHQKDMTGSY